MAHRMASLKSDIQVDKDFQLADLTKKLKLACQNLRYEEIFVVGIASYVRKEVMISWASDEI